MKSVVKLILVGVAITTALFASYWWGTTQSQSSAGTAISETASTEKKILYYRNPMGLPDTSPVPKKDSMGMDYLPVYEGEESPSDQTIIKISTEKIQMLGVLTETATLRELTRTIRAVATIQADERKLYTLVTKFEGWIQRLYVNTTGQAVRKGDALMDVYSPELITAQQEYLIAVRGLLQSTADSDSDVQASMQRLVTSALQKLRNWDIAETELQRLQQTGEVRQYMTLRSKADGVVLEKKAVMGQRFMPGEVLYQIADLSSVWMLADVFEQDLGMVHQGQVATIRVEAYPNKVFNGEIAFIYPTVTPETRTAIVRVVLPNPDGLLKPAMYARVEFASSHSKDKVLAIPDSAVLDTGTRRVVLVDLGAGRFEPRTVKLGMHADGYAEVLGGINAGETVVVKANFLIDAESNLKAVLSGFGHGGHQLPDEKKETGADSFAKASPSKTHRGEGTINAMDFAHATITLAHGPIASLQWPAMTMDFRVFDPALLRSLKPGQKVAFEITEESAGEYIIVHIQPADLSLGTTAHGGH
ncbi:Cu(I)/Ag(I) efflux system membrane fusion protein [Nitrosomonas oligotropha]|uniref:Cu(I)/Ag(I) efflux system membrane fusion protein n=1 Tax=Nitrosomonas oligotropha TaxID=42354 RepID=A0A2T5HYV5_9PROT|nr:efflux RND transporter periplasmic adaptor subunit [Nitrosomonas oligotropha]PTQ76769.1 Cu(I)/Ag(I) efflux system membrane fusion protein [Nitrosomonas oligotropha]